MIVNNKINKNDIKGMLFASPWIIGFLVFSVYPIFLSFYYSFTKFNLFQKPAFIGLSNYTDLFKDELFIKSLYNTFYMIILGTPVSLMISLLLAILLNVKVKSMSIHRTIFYLPTIVPAIASSLLWLWVFNPSNGLLNFVLGNLGLPKANWFADPVLSKPSLIIMGFWGAGNVMIIFLASLQEIPKSLYESSQIDGANIFQRFFHITIPWISPIILFQLIMSFINNFQYFTQAYIIAGGTTHNNVMSGGPENSLLFYALYLFHTAFGYFKMGKASAMAWILFVIVAFVTWLTFKTSNKWVNYGGE